MDRTLDTINEDETDLYTSSSETNGDNLPTVTPKQRTFADTVQKTEQGKQGTTRENTTRQNSSIIGRVIRTGTKLQRKRS